jgi:hypothetical protein
MRTSSSTRSAISVDLSSKNSSLVQCWGLCFDIFRSPILSWTPICREPSGFKLVRVKASLPTTGRKDTRTGHLKGIPASADVRSERTAFIDMLWNSRCPLALAQCYSPEDTFTQDITLGFNQFPEVEQRPRVLAALRARVAPKIRAHNWLRQLFPAEGGPSTVRANPPSTPRLAHGPCWEPWNN